MVRRPMRRWTIPPSDFDRWHVGWRERDGVALVTLAFK
jgi:hypothetical protein